MAKVWTISFVDAREDRFWDTRGMAFKAPGGNMAWVAPEYATSPTHEAHMVQGAVQKISDTRYFLTTEAGDTYNFTQTTRQVPDDEADVKLYLDGFFPKWEWTSLD